MRLLEHGRVLEVGAALALAAVAEPELGLEVALDPHLAHDVAVQREVGRRHELDEDARS